MTRISRSLFCLSRRALAVIGIWSVLAVGAAGQVSITEGPVTVVGDTVSEDLARRVLTAAAEDVRAYGFRLPPGDEPITIVVTTTEAEFARYAGGLGRRNVLGAARSNEGIIIMKTPDLLGTRASMRPVLRHEILHVLLARNTDLKHVPRWLNEGIAMEVSGEMRWTGLWELARMYLQGRLLDYHQLNLAFGAPGNEVEFGDAYVQSHSLVKKLMRDLGEQRFWEMVYALQAAPFEEVLPEYLGTTPEDFFDAWYAGFWWTAVVTTLASSLTLFQVMALLLVVAYLKKRRKGRRIVRQWEADEEEDEGPVYMPWDYEDGDEWKRGE